MSMPQSFLLLPSFLPPASLVRIASRPPPPPSLTVLRFHRIDAKLSPPLLAASHGRPGGFHGYGDSGGSDGGSGGDGGRGMDSPDPGDGWWRRWLQALHPEFLLLFLLLMSGAASTITETLGNSGGDVCVGGGACGR